MDLKSKVDTLNTELDSLLQTRNFDQRKCKELERRVVELESEVESKSKMYDEIIQEFQNVYEKISEFEGREVSYINTVTIFRSQVYFQIEALREDLENAASMPSNMLMNQEETEELQQTIKHLERRLSAETDEKTVYRNLVDRLVEGFDNPNINSVTKELFNVSMDRSTLKFESEMMKNRILEDEDRVDDSQNWRNLVNDLRFNLEDKSKKEQLLSAQYEEKLTTLDRILREERKKSQKIRDLEGEIAEFKIHMRKMKSSAPSYGLYSTGDLNMKRPASPVIMQSSSQRIPRRSHQSVSSLQSNPQIKQTQGVSLKNTEIGKLFSDCSNSVNR